MLVICWNFTQSFLLKTENLSGVFWKQISKHCFFPPPDQVFFIVSSKLILFSPPDQVCLENCLFSGLNYVLCPTQYFLKNDNLQVLIIITFSSAPDFFVCLFLVFVLLCFMFHVHYYFFLLCFLRQNHVLITPWARLSYLCYPVPFINRDRIYF